MPPTGAACCGSSSRSAVEVGRPTLYAMLIIIAALVPVFTLQSVEGRIFRPLALTYSLRAARRAGVRADHWCRRVCAALFRPRDARLQEPGWIDGCARLPRSLAGMLERRALVFAAALVMLALGALTITRLGTEFLPELDEGDIQLFRRDAAEHLARKRAGHPARSAQTDPQFPEVRKT